MGKRIPIGIVTTKDLDFIRERMPFVHGISAVSGLQMQIGDKIFLDESVQKSNAKLEKACQDAIAQILQVHDEVVIEKKTTEDDDLIAFCIDWRLSRGWEEARKKVEPILVQCRQAGLYVAEADSSPFVNVYASRVDKGTALKRLRQELGVTGPIIYLGDSEADNPAFQVADVSIGVKHRRIMPELACKYQLEFFQLESFILKLLDADLDFSDDMVEKNANVLSLNVSGKQSD